MGVPGRGAYISSRAQTFSLRCETARGAPIYRPARGLRLPGSVRPGAAGPGNGVFADICFVGRAAFIAALSLVLGIFVFVELLLRMGWGLGFPLLFVAVLALVLRGLFMRIVFMGTPEFAVPSLTSLVAAGNEIALVVTRPDAVRGRGKKLEPSPVKAKALELGLPVVEANRMTPEVVEALQAAQADIFCVAAYGCILPDEVLHMAPLGIVNVHASLLPRWRGAAPIQRAILAGDEVAGVSIMRIGHGVDTGAYCAQASTSVAGKHAEALTMELGELGGKLLADTLPSLADGTAVWTEQDEAFVTHAAKISKREMRLDPQMSALDCVRHVLASSDTAPARCVIAGKTVRMLDAAPADVSLGKGAVVVKSKRVYLGLSDGAVELLEVKPDGKRAMAASAWAAGLQGADLTWGVLS